MAHRLLPGGFNMTEVGTADLQPVSHDDRLVSKIMAKRQDELARRARLLNPRSRFGVPHEVLDEQIAAKRRAQEQEALDEAAYAEHARLQEQVLNVIEEGKQQAMRDRDKAARDFSLTNLHRGQRREFALSDPNAIRNERLPGESGEQLGLSSMQHFEGEGRGTKETAHRLKQMQAQWLAEQVAEKEARAAAEREADLRADHHMMMANQVRGICEEEERQNRLQDKLEETAENQLLAQQQALRRQERQRKELDEQQRHVDHVRTGDLLTEASDYKLGVDGRLQRAEYKRCSMEEEQDVYDTNAKLVLEKKAQREREAREEAEHAASVNFGVAVLGHIEEERARQLRERRRRMNEHNSGLSQTKRASDTKERQEYLSFHMNFAT